MNLKICNKDDENKFHKIAASSFLHFNNIVFFDEDKRYYVCFSISKKDGFSMTYIQTFRLVQRVSGKVVRKKINRHPITEYKYIQYMKNIHPEYFI